MLAISGCQQAYSPITRQISPEEEAALQKDFQDSLEVYIGCTAFYAKKFSNSGEEAPIIAAAAAAKCSEQKNILRKAFKAKIYEGRPNDALSEMFYEQEAIKMANNIERQTKQRAVGAIVEEKSKQK